MTRLKITLAVVLGLMFSLPAFAQSSKDLQRAFMKIEAQVETGINYRDYSVLVGDANLELKLYAATKDGTQHAQAVANFNSALLQYEVASSLWERRLEGDSWDTISPTEPLYQKLLASYPDAAKSLEDGGATVGRGLDIKFLLPLIWERAAEKSKLAMSLM